MSQKILFVDDEPNVLSAYERQLRKRYTIETATSGAAGLDKLQAGGPFAVVVSDLRMPSMDGIQFLARARELHPDAVRILLTGYADVQQAIDAVNHGSLFRFLTKPCPHETITTAIDAALAQHSLVVSERELLDKTLRGSVQVLGEVLALVNPTAFGRALRVQQLINGMSAYLEGAKAWEIDVAAMLSQLGYIAVPEATLAAAGRGASLSHEERKQLEAHPSVARDLLRAIPRLERVIEIITYQDKSFSAPGWPGSEKSGKTIPFGARLMKVALDFDALAARGVPRPQALSHMLSRPGDYDPDVLNALTTLIGRENAFEIREVTIVDLAPGMVLAEDLYSDGGLLLLSRGNPITTALQRRLEASVLHGRSPKLIKVLMRRQQP
jgi:response regulator RpfG family c-di-GMP phosphodiesterase